MHIAKYKAPILITLLFITYFSLRTTNLNLQPVFCDEGIYIRWAQKVAQNPKENLFIPLTDGKTPLFMWLIASFLKLIKDPLIAGRAVSVLAGILSLIGTIYLGKKFFNIKTALTAGFFFATTPFLVFFDKMALTDSLLASLSFWSLILALEVSKSGSIKKTIILGLALGLSILTKIPGIFNFINLPLALLATTSKKLKKSITNLTIAGLIGASIYNLLRFSSYFERLSQRNDYYHFPIKRLLEKPFDPLFGNLTQATEFMSKMMTWPIFFLFISGIIYSIYKRERTNIVILLWGIIPLIAMASLLKVYTARYLLPSIVPFVFMASYAFVKLTERIKTKALSLALLIAVLTPSFVFDYHLLKDPQNANLPAKEKEGYFEGWTAGYGLKEMAMFLEEKAKEERILLVTAGAFGTLPDGIGIYLFENPNIEIWYSNSYLELYIYEAAKERKTFFLVHKSNFTPNPNLKLIKEIPKPPWKETPSDFLLLYEITN